MSLTVHVERTLDNRNDAERIAWLEAQNACLRERIHALEDELAQRRRAALQPLPDGFHLVQTAEIRR